MGQKLVCGGRAAKSGETIGYLVERETDMGSLYFVWSKVRIPHAIAELHPQTPVPAFKLKQAEEKLISPANLGVHKMNYWQGWCEFVKKARQLGALVKVRSGSRVVLTAMRNGRMCDASGTFSPKDFDAVACGGKDSTNFKGVKAMAPTAFSSQ